MALLQQLREQWSLSKPVTAGIALSLAFLLAVGVISHVEFMNLRLLTQVQYQADQIACFFAVSPYFITCGFRKVL